MYRRHEDRREPGQNEGDAKNGCATGGRAGQGVRPVQVRHGQVLGVRGHGVHGHHLPSSGHVQNGTDRRRRVGGRPEAQGARRGRAPGGRRVDYADDRPGQH